VAIIAKDINRSIRRSILEQASGESKYTYVKHQIPLLKTHPQVNEKWIQEKIAEDPSILGVGELILKDKERTQPKTNDKL